MRRPGDLPIRQRPPDTEIDKRFKEIMQSSGKLKINDVVYSTDIKEMEYIEELGSGTCGQVVKMRHKPSDEIIAVKVGIFRFQVFLCYVCTSAANETVTQYRGE